MDPIDGHGNASGKGLRRVAVGLAVPTLLIAAFIATLNAVDRFARRTTTTTTSFRVSDFGEGIREIKVRGSGDIAIVGRSSAEIGEGAPVQVKRRATGGLRKPTVSTRIKGSTLELEGKCPFLALSCSVDFEVSLPDDVLMKLSTSGGDLAVRHQRADVVARSSGGDVSVFDVVGSVSVNSSGGDLALYRITGSINAATSGGDVLGVSLDSMETKASSSGGDVNITFLRAPKQVRAKSSGGDVIISLPRGEESYNAVATSSGGDNSVGVKTDPASPNRVRADTSGGDAHIEYADRP